MTKNEFAIEPNLHENNRTFYDRISGAYDLIADAGEHKAREAGEKALDLQPGEKVLEIGFGTGNTVINFSGAVGENGSVYGIDISPGMLHVAETKIRKEKTTAPIKLTVSDARELPFAENTFDAVFTGFTLELFPLADISAVLLEAKRVLKPGGRIGIVSMSVVKEGEHPSLLENAYVWMHRHFPHLVDCQPIDVQHHVTAAGLTISQATEVKIWTMPVAVVVAKK